MEIIHFNTQKDWRGGERQLAWLIDELNQKDIKQTLFCRKKSKLETHAINQDINYQSFNIKFYNLFLLSYILKKHTSKRDDIIIHCHDSKSHTIALLAKIFFMPTCKIIVDRKVMFPIKGWFSQQIKYSSKYINSIICISNAVRNNVFESTKHKNIAVIGDMIKPNNTQKGTILSSKFGIKKEYIIGYIAAMTAEKDHITFLKAAKEINKTNPEIGFVLIGDGKLFDEIKAYTRELKLENNVYLLGFISTIPEIIQEIDLLLFTSISEGLGSTILDFFMAKKPVVTVKNGGSEELVFQNKTGLICNKKAYSDLANNCLKFYSDPEFTDLICENAFEFASQNFTPSSITSKIISEYSKVISH
jgi:glycosyltransferase involved in cell wall biosynthesis